MRRKVSAQNHTLDKVGCPHAFRLADWPWSLGLQLQVERHCARQRIAVEGATPKRAAAARQPMPPSIAVKAARANP